MPVYITRTAHYLPFDAVGNDEMESVLGKVGNKASRARALVLRSNGIKSRHYAIDRATGLAAMNNAQLTTRAIQNLGLTDKEGDRVDVLAAGTSTPDQLMPSHAVMVHGNLAWSRLEVVSCAGICLSGIAALKHAWLSVASGSAQRAVACASELVSPMMRASHFEAELQHQVQALEKRPEIAFEKDFLRWMLSDGAGALLLENQPPPILYLCASTGSACPPLPMNYQPACMRVLTVMITLGKVPICKAGSHSRQNNSKRVRYSPSNKTLNCSMPTLFAQPLQNH